MADPNVERVWRYLCGRDAEIASFMGEKHLKSEQLFEVAKSKKEIFTLRVHRGPWPNRTTPPHERKLKDGVTRYETDIYLSDYPRGKGGRTAFDKELLKDATDDAAAADRIFAYQLYHELVHARLLIEGHKRWPKAKSGLRQEYEAAVERSKSSALDSSRVISRLRTILAMAQRVGLPQEMYEHLIDEKYVVSKAFRALEIELGNDVISRAYTADAYWKLFKDSVGNKASFQNALDGLRQEVSKLYDALDLAGKPGSKGRRGPQEPRRKGKGRRGSSSPESPQVPREGGRGFLRGLWDRIFGAGQEEEQSSVGRSRPPFQMPRLGSLRSTHGLSRQVASDGEDPLSRRRGPGSRINPAMSPFLGPFGLRSPFASLRSMTQIGPVRIAPLRRARAEPLRKVMMFPRPTTRALQPFGIRHPVRRAATPRMAPLKHAPLRPTPWPTWQRQQPFVSKIKFPKKASSPPPSPRRSRPPQTVPVWRDPNRYVGSGGLIS